MLFGGVQEFEKDSLENSHSNIQRYSRCWIFLKIFKELFKMFLKTLKDPKSFSKIQSTFKDVLEDLKVLFVKAQRR